MFDRKREKVHPYYILIGERLGGATTTISLWWWHIQYITRALGRGPEVIVTRL